VIVAATRTLRGGIARAMLDWLVGIGRLGTETDLCLLRDEPGFAEDDLDAESAVETGDRVWSLATVDGDLALRLALMRAEGRPLVAFTACDEEQFQPDLRERAALRRVVRVPARQIVSALTGRDCAALDDERFRAPLLAVLGSPRRGPLLDAVAARSWGSTVRDSDAASVLCAAAFSFDDRYSEDAPGALLAHWLRDPPLATPELLVLARETAARRLPPYAPLLAESSFDAAALFGAAAEARDDLSEDLARLALGAARLLQANDAGLLERLLAPAEEAFVARRLPASDRPPLLLRTAYESEARRLAQSCETAGVATADDVAASGSYIYAAPKQTIALDRLTRFARGMQGAATHPMPTDIRGFAARWRADVAWLDRAARRVRETAFTDPEAARIARTLTERWYVRRDELNAAFARVLVHEWPTVDADPGTTAPLTVAHILKHVVKPKLETWKTFLVVLDGCDVSTFLEIVAAFDAEAIRVSRFDVALSLIPTMTSHARRGLFGGEVPRAGIAADDDTGAHAAGDRKAFEGANRFLGNVGRKLFLKGDLADGGTAICQVLRSDEPQYRLIAAVFNDVDDALGSKERAVLPERTLDRCTAAFREAMVAAFESGRRIVVTADHGHTPYRDGAPRAPKLDHARFTELAPSAAAPPQTVVIERSDVMPYRIAALHALGTHSGAEHVGYHGGISLEEMFVPLAIYEPGSETRPIESPDWWGDVYVPHASSPGLRERQEALQAERVQRTAERNVGKARAQAAQNLPTASPPPHEAPGPTVGSLNPPTAPKVHATGKSAVGEAALVPYLAALSENVPLRTILLEIARSEVLDLTQLAAAVGMKRGLLRTRVTGLNGYCSAAGLSEPIGVSEDDVFRWIGPR